MTKEEMEMDLSFFDVYVLPWAINIALAAAIFIVGRMVTKVLVNLLGKALRKDRKSVV